MCRHTRKPTVLSRAADHLIFGDFEVSASVDLASTAKLNVDLLSKLVDTRRDFLDAKFDLVSSPQTWERTGCAREVHTPHEHEHNSQHSGHTKPNTHEQTPPPPHDTTPYRTRTLPSKKRSNNDCRHLTLHKAIELAKNVKKKTRFTNLGLCSERYWLQPNTQEQQQWDRHSHEQTQMPKKQEQMISISKLVVAPVECTQLVEFTTL